MAQPSERGSILLLALAIITIVAGMVTTLVTISMARSKGLGTREQKFTSREIAESGAMLSMNNLRQVTDGKDNDANGQVDDGCDVHPPEVPYGHFSASEIAGLEGQLGRIGTLWWTASDDANNNGWPDFGESHVQPSPLSGGEFFAYTLFSELDGLDNDGDGTVDEGDESGSVTVFALGRYPAGAGGIVSRVVCSAIFTEEQPPPDPPLWSPNSAIAAGSALEVSGTSDITGDGGSVHSNDVLTLSGGAARIEQTATACNGITGNTSQVLNLNGAPLAVNPAAPEADLPDPRPETLKSLATHIFAADGAVYDANGTQVSPPGANFGGWKLDGTTGEWTLSGQVSYTGVAYLEGNVKLSGVGGNNPPPVNMSIIATGNLQVTGNGTYISALPATQLLFVAGGDIKLTGASSSGDQVFEGVIVAREQIHQSGTSDLNGVMTAANLDDRHALVTENRVTGTALVYYDGTIDTNLPVYIPTNRYILDPAFSAYEEQ